MLKQYTTGRLLVYVTMTCVVLAIFGKPIMLLLSCWRQIVGPTTTAFNWLWGTPELAWEFNDGTIIGGFALLLGTLFAAAIIVALILGVIVLFLYLLDITRHKKT